MRRSRIRTLIPLLLITAFSGCSKVIPLSEYKYPPRSPDAEVVMIDARSMARAELQRVLVDYDMVARFHQFTREGERYDADVAEVVERAKTEVRKRGGHALLYTHDSETIAAIYQDVRYAGRSNALVMYILRRKDAS